MSNEIWKIFRFLVERVYSPWKAGAVFTRNDEGLDHLRLLEVAAKLIQFAEPELITILVRITLEIAKVFHHHKHLVRLRANKSIILDYLAQHSRARERVTS